MAKKRTRWTPKQAGCVLDDLDASGLNVLEFSKKYKLDPKRLRRWRTRLGREEVPVLPRLVELVNSEKVAHARLHVHFPSGHWVEVTDVELDVGLRAALTAVAELGSRVSAC